jgi:threonine synthase
VALYGGVMDEQGKVSKEPDFAALRRDIYSVSVGDTETRQAIKDAWHKYKTMLEPHGAVGWAGLERYLESSNPRPLGSSPLAISIETAHPAKFPGEIQRLLGVDPPLPPSLVGLDAKPEQYEKGPNDYEWFRNFLGRKFKGA